MKKIIPGPIFHKRENPPPKRNNLAERILNRFPHEFSTLEEAREFLAHIFTPASRRWAYAGNGKSGTTSTKRFLFELEFGVPLTVNLTAEHDINSDVLPHMISAAGVFRSLVLIPNPLESLQEAFRITTARHPVARAISSFRYLCLADEKHHTWLSQDRIRMNAMVRFDWRKDRYTLTGFRKFLEYAERTQVVNGEISDPHWRCQVDNVRPDIFKPHLIGRTENLGNFFRQIANHFDQPLPEGWIAPHSNSQGHDRELAERLLTPDSLREIGKIFARDFEWLQEEPDSWIQRSSKPL